MTEIRVEPPLTLIVDAQNDMGESPIWSAVEQALYWIDVNRSPQILRWNAATGAVDRWAMPERIGGLVL